MPKYYALLRLLNEMEDARPQLVYRPDGERSGYAVTAAGREELRKRDLLDES